MSSDLQITARTRTVQGQDIAEPNASTTGRIDRAGDHFDRTAPTRAGVAPAASTPTPPRPDGIATHAGAAPGASVLAPRPSVAKAKLPAVVEETPLVMKEDIPGYVTYSWFKKIHDTASAQVADPLVGLGPATALLMLAATPVVVPLALVGDVINTALFPVKVLARYKHRNAPEA